jgi:hypothetical protein
MAHDFLTTLATVFEIASALYIVGAFAEFVHRKSSLCHQAAEAIVEASEAAVNELAETVEEIDQELTEVILDGFTQLDAAATEVVEEIIENVEKVAFDIKAHVAANYGGIRGLKKFASGKVKNYSKMDTETLWGRLVEDGFVEAP